MLKITTELDIKFFKDGSETQCRKNKGEVLNDFQMDSDDLYICSVSVAAPVCRSARLLVHTKVNAIRKAAIFFIKITSVFHTVLHIWPDSVKKQGTPLLYAGCCRFFFS